MGQQIQGFRPRGRMAATDDYGSLPQKGPQRNPGYLPQHARASQEIQEQDAPPQIQRAIYSASRERSVGVGALGFHSYLQKKNGKHMFEM